MKNQEKNNKMSNFNVKINNDFIFVNGVSLKNRKISLSPHHFRNIILLKNFHINSNYKMDKSSKIFKKI